MLAKVNEDGLSYLGEFLVDVSDYEKVQEIKDTETDYSKDNYTRYKIGEYWFFDYCVDLYPKKKYPEMYL